MVGLEEDLGELYQQASYAGGRRVTCGRDDWICQPSFSDTFGKHGEGFTGHIAEQFTRIEHDVNYNFYNANWCASVEISRAWAARCRVGVR